HERRHSWQHHQKAGAGTSEGAELFAFSVEISVMTTILEADKRGDRTGAVDAIVKATSCGVDDATIVVFMLEGLDVIEGEG
ncbi:Hypothetical predicted protein, partial [Paramuricea clavata]